MSAINVFQATIFCTCPYNIYPFIALLLTIYLILRRPFNTNRKLKLCFKTTNAFSYSNPFKFDTLGCEAIYFTYDTWIISIFFVYRYSGNVYPCFEYNLPGG